MTASRRLAPRSPFAPILLLILLSVPPSWAANIRFIVFSSSLNAGDLAMRNLMQSFGHTVTVKSAPSSSAADTTGQDLIVISSSVGTGEVNTKFRNVAKPVITLKYGLFDEMGMVSAAAYQAGGFAGGQTAIQNPGHFLAAGHSGTVQVFSPDDNLNWGLPAASAFRIASLTNDASRSTIFAYESGAAMVGMDAPARRLAFLYRDNGATRTTAQGQALFQAAINWSLGSDGPPPVAPAITSPPSPVSVIAGEAATFSVTATGTPAPSFQWHRDGNAIAGATGASYTTPAAGPADDGALFTVTAANGSGSVTSAAARLDVAYAPIIADQPDAADVPAGAAATFTVAASGNPAPGYQWQRNGVDIPGAASASYTLIATVADDSSTYRVSVQNTQGAVVSAQALLRVLRQPYFVQPVFTGAEGRPGDTLTIAFLANGYPAPSYAWTSTDPDPGPVTEGRIFRVILRDDPAGTFHDYAVTATNSQGGDTRSVRITNLGRPLAAPVITSHPVTATTDEGLTADFSVTATGHPAPAYQWLKNGEAIPGAVAASHTTPITARQDDNSVYSVVVGNSQGLVTSDGAVLRVRYQPAFLGHPAGQTRHAGESATFTVSAEGNPAPAFQWRKNGADIPGATGAAYTTPPLEAFDDSSVYQARAVNSQGSVVSQGGILRVTSAPVFNGFQDTALVMAGGTATFNPAVQGFPAPSFQWRKNGVDIPDAANRSYTTPPTTGADNGAIFSLVAANAFGTVEFAAGVLVVFHAPVITSQPAGVTIAQGGTATFTVTAHALPAPTYQWTRNGVAIAGAVSATYTTPATTRFDDLAEYRVMVSNVHGSVASQPAQLRVLYAPVFTLQPVSHNIYPGNPVTLQVTVVGNPAPTYQWQKFDIQQGVDVPIPGATARTYAVPTNVPPQTQMFFNVLATNTQGTTQSYYSQVWVQALPVITVSPPSTTVQYGQSITFSINATPYPGSTFQWFTGGILIDGATGSSYTISSATFNHHLWGLSVRVTHPTFTVMSDTSRLRVEGPPIFTDQPDNIAVTAGQTATFRATAPAVPSASLQWHKNGIPIPGATAATYVTPPTGPLDDQSAFFVVATNSYGAATSAEAILTVNYAPTITVSPVSGSVEVGQTHVFGVEASAKPAATYQWRKNGAVIPGAVDPVLTTLPATPADNGSVYSVVVSNAIGSVEASATLTVLQAPVVTAGPVPLTVVEDANFTFTVTAQGSPPITGYQWQRNGVDIPGATSASYTKVAWESDDSTFYRAAVTNPVGTVFSEAALLRVEYAPGWLSQGGLRQFGLAGDSVEFEFRIQANPPATFFWMVNGMYSQPLPPPPVPDGSQVIRFRAAVPLGPVGASHIYILNASNRIGGTSNNASAVCMGFPPGPPVIWRQPVGGSFTAGQQVNLAVDADGYPQLLTYQWRRNGADIPGATASNLAFTAAGDDDGDAFSVAVSNTEGTTISQPVTVVVQYAPIITQQPPAETTGNAGMPTVFQVQATGNPAPTYQWSKDGVPVPGATSANYFTPNLLLSDDGSQFEVTVTNPLGSVTSMASLLRVLPALAAPAITSEPQDLFLYPGEAAVFRVGFTGYPTPAVSWTVVSPTFEPGPHAGDSLWLGPVEVADDGTRVQARVQNQMGMVMTREAILRVSQRPTRHLVSLTGELFDEQNLGPIGYNHVTGADVIVRLYPQPEGGTAVYTEEFLRAEGRTVAVDRGLFTVRLGQGRTTQVLSEVAARHGNLYAELTVEAEDMPRETLLPRTPITSPMLAGTPRILQGTANPAAAEPVGTYYENTADGSTWLRMPAAWVRIAP